MQQEKKKLELRSTRIIGYHAIHVITDLHQDYNLSEILYDKNY
jgi:hypothetical protein